MSHEKQAPKCGPTNSLGIRCAAQGRLSAALIAVALIAPSATRAQELAPLVYTLRFPAPEKQTFDVEVAVPTEKRAAVEMLMATWSPGYYVVENYADQVTNLVARGPDGAALQVDHPQRNRWTVHSDGHDTIVVKYTLAARRAFVTGNSVDEKLAVITGPATYITLLEQAHRRAEVRLELPAAWKHSATSLDPSPDGAAHHFVAPDFDVLADSPILAGTLSVHEFEVAGSAHYLVDAGRLGEWDGEHGANQLKRMVEEQSHFWGALPFERYVFLNVFRQGGGGLEHLNSCLLTSSPRQAAKPEAYFSWAAYVSHEYFHAINVKRLRPIELGPFDYEHPPVTTGLWVAEGLTTYYGELLAARAELGTPTDFLRTYSGHIGRLQNTPGRLVQTLEQSSAQIFGNGGSGVGGDGATTVSYYVKGPLVGWLLDAHIRHATSDARSLDDVMRLANRRFSGAQGFTGEQFRQCASEAAGIDLAEWLGRALATTEELDYSEALDWLGLRFTPDDPDPKQKWTLEVRPDATTSQQAHFASFFAPSKAK